MAIVGCAGAAASLVFYAVEYFPEHMALRLAVNHPLHSVRGSPRVSLSRAR
jgi:hypothetical protein